MSRYSGERSTGPDRSRKARSRLNALQHGLTSKTIVLPGENTDGLQALYQQVRDDLKPEGAFEEQLVERIASCFWRLRRCERVEEELYAYRLLQDIEDDGQSEMKPITPTLSRMDGIPYYSEDDRREGVVAALLAREEIQEVGISMGRAFLRDVVNGNGLGSLSRYETTHLRNLQRYWAELTPEADNATTIHCLQGQ